MKTIDFALQREVPEFNSHIDRILRSDNPKMTEIISWVLQSRGKQIRPKLLCLCSKFGKPNQNITKIAAMIEILHTASLIHDDIIDNSKLRRGYLSVQEKFGKHMAVYAGDYMIFCIVNEAIHDPSYRKYHKLFSIVKEMCYGELGQDAVLYRMDISENDYINNIIGKTAILFQNACELGAQLSKAPEHLVTALSNYGKNLGLLFQIRDDLLDYTSTELNLGKPVLSDFQQGIYTLPLIYAFKDIDSKDKLYAISQQTQNKELTLDQAKKIINIVENSKGLEKTKLKADEFFCSALSSVELLPDQPEKDLLKLVLNKVYHDINI